MPTLSRRGHNCLSYRAFAADKTTEIEPMKKTSWKYIHSLKGNKWSYTLLCLEFTVQKLNSNQPVCKFSSKWRAVGLLCSKNSLDWPMCWHQCTPIQTGCWAGRCWQHWQNAWSCLPVSLAKLYWFMGRREGKKRIYNKFIIITEWAHTHVNCISWCYMKHRPQVFLSALLLCKCVSNMHFFFFPLRHFDEGLYRWLIR